MVTMEMAKPILLREVRFANHKNKKKSKQNKKFYLYCLKIIYFLSSKCIRKRRLVYVFK